MIENLESVNLYFFMPLLTYLYKAFACIARDFTITKSEAYGFQLFNLSKIICQIEDDGLLPMI